MAQKSGQKRSAGKSLLYVLIPAGFVLIVVIMLLSGWWKSDEEGQIETVPNVNEQPIQN